MCLEKVTLISKDECGDVDVSEETARSVNYVILYIYLSFYSWLKRIHSYTRAKRVNLGENRAINKKKV
jgi:hypothetical protein